MPKSRPALLNWTTLTTRLCQGLSIALLWSTLWLVWLPQPAWAHRPHDVVTQIKLSPAYDQDQTAYTLTRGNLFKSVDGGDHWQRLVQGLDSLNPLSTLSIDAKKGQVLAVATRGNGVYRSEDGGQSWAQVNQGLSNLNIEVVYVSPTDLSLMLAAGAEGELYRTTDSGKTWTQTLDKSHTVLALATADSTLFAGEASGQLLGSSNGGQTWQPLAAVEDKITAIAASGDYASDDTLYIGTESKGVFQINPNTQAINALNEGLTDLRIQDIKTVPGNPDTVIISSWDRGISISTDRGQSWTDYPEGLVKDKMADDDGVTHFSEIALSKTFQEDQTAFVGGFNGLYKSTDLGHTWQEVETLSLGTVIAMDVSPNYGEDGTLAIATYVGKIMLSEDQGETWRLAMEGIEVPRLHGSFETPYQDPRRFFDIAFSPDYANDQTLWTTTLWTKYVKSTNRGQSWSLHTLSQEARGLTLLVSPDFATDRTLFIGNQKGVMFGSTNGGRSFNELSKLPWKRGNDSPTLAISPNFAADQTLYTIGETGIYQSTDAGKTWKSLTEDSPIANQQSLQLVISPAYATDQTLFVSSFAGVYRSQDAGATWQPLDNLVEINPNVSLVEGIALSPNFEQDGTVLISLRGQGLYKSTNQGDTFQAIGDQSLAYARMFNVPSAGRPIQFSPNYAEDNTLFAFGSATTDVFRSQDGGDTWQVLTTPDIETPAELSPLKKIAITAELSRGKLLKIGAAITVALLSYVMVGFLHLEKVLNIKRRLLQFGAAMGSFAISLVVLFKVL